MIDSWNTLLHVIMFSYEVWWMRPIHETWESRTCLLKCRFFVHMKPYDFSITSRLFQWHKLFNSVLKCLLPSHWQRKLLIVRGRLCLTEVIFYYKNYIPMERPEGCGPPISAAYVPSTIYKISTLKYKNLVQVLRHLSIWLMWSGSIIYFNIVYICMSLQLQLCA